ncbi:hypothetical protein [Spongiactinospora sp. 9N601]|uniref:hypothetical protein n=1 Tax=Spongiactinospora sp. 9N601 TaxID=3375149 RepID=UPI00378B8E14
MPSIASPGTIAGGTGRMAPDQSSHPQMPPAWPDVPQGGSAPPPPEHAPDQDRKGRGRPSAPPRSWDGDPLGPPHTPPAVPPSATSDVNYERTVAVPMRPREEAAAPPRERSAPRRQGDTPGGTLGRDPADPNRPFVTAGQISGPKTPPPERQQELWNTVFGDNYQAMEDEERPERTGKPVWIYALAGTIAVALVAVLLWWAFTSGPLASAEGPASTQTAQKTAAPQKPAAPKKTLPRLPRYKGAASQSAGTLTDQLGGITLPKLGPPWRQDLRPTVREKFGYPTRQYVPAGRDAAGKTQFGQVLSGPLPKQLAGKYGSPEDLTPVVSAVAFQARTKYFAKGNTIAKTVHQTKPIGGMPAELIGYEITSAQTKTTMVVAVVATGRDVPTVVFMMVPETKKKLLPDINTVFAGIRPVNGS